MTVRRTNELIKRWGGFLLLVCFLGPASAFAQQTAGQNPFAQWGRETLAVIERDFRMPAGGGYYEDHHRKNTAFAWGHAILLQAYAKAAQLDPSYRQPLENLVEFLQSYWVVENGLGGYDCLPAPRKRIERYYDDNAWLAMGLMDAYVACGRPDYLEQAGAALNFCLSGLDKEGGIWWRQTSPLEPGGTKNTCSTAPTAYACLRYYELTGQESFLKTAQALLEWLEKTLEDEDGLFFDSIGRDGRLHRRKWSYNSAMPLRCRVLLYRLTGRKDYLDKAIRLAEACRSRWFDESSGAIRCESMFAFTLVEAWVELSAASGRPQWLQRAQKAMHYVHQNVRDSRGRYAKRWDYVCREPLERWNLLYPAAAARAYWVLADASQNQNNLDR